MSPDNHIPGRMDTPVDKFHAHYRQQLSALVDGELAPDEARFMLRRIEHDDELSGCQERWQLLGDALRGQACAPAPADFSLRVRQAIAADIGQHGAVTMVPRQTPRRGWARWGGGAALAASVAAVALFMAREQLPETATPGPVIAATAEMTPPAVPVKTDPAPVNTDTATLVAAAPAVAVAAARRQDAARRGSATRSQQSARASAVRTAEPAQRAIAATLPPAVTPISPGLRQDPFGSGTATLQARPWPRSSVAPALSQGALNASFPAPQEQGGTRFYPFEPRLPEQGGDEAELRRLLQRH